SCCAPHPSSPAISISSRTRAAACAICAACNSAFATTRGPRSSRPSPSRPSMASSTSIVWSAWCCVASRTTSSYPHPLSTTRTTTMTDEIAQLLKSLHLGRIAEILDDELKAAEKGGFAYAELIAKLLRAQWHANQENALKWRIKRAGLPEQWTIESFPFKR